MDKHNLFHSRAAYRLVRLDYLVVLLSLVGLAIAHLDEIRWIPLLVAFWWIDLVGTLPAWYVYYLRRSGEHRSIPRACYVLYNVAHSAVTNAVVIAIWYLAVGGWEWAMLAAPIHICGDRALFGNIYKPMGLSFEPVPNPAFQRFLRDYEAAGRW